MIARWARATPDLMRISVARHVAYRSELTIWVLTALLPLIMLMLWDAVVADGPVAGFGRAEMARYFVAALIVRQFTGAWLIWELNFEIRQGRLSTRLLRPFNVFYPYAVWMLMAMPFRAAILTPMLAVIVAWRPELLWMPPPATLAVFLVSLALAWLLNFLIQAFFGILSFWIDKSDGIFGVWFAAYSLLSGYVAPLAMFPDSWRPVLDVLPFRGLLAVPVELLGGFLSPQDALRDLAFQAGWCLFFLALVMFTWKRGLKRYGAFGA